MIGVFDSGIGGLTVWRALREQLPDTPLIYFGDTARVPYGNRSKETVRRCALECAQFLLQQQISLLVVACNTACADALELLKKQLPIPVVGVIDPAIEAACAVGKRLGVIGTRRTIASGVYQKGIELQQPGARVHAIACPLFVPLVEEHFWDHEATHAIARHYLHGLHKKLDALILGCTHYPLLKNAIQQVVGEQVELIDSASACAHTVKQLLNTTKYSSCTHKFYVSDDPDRFRELGSLFLGEELPAVAQSNPNADYRYQSSESSRQPLAMGPHLTTREITHHDTVPS